MLRVSNNHEVLRTVVERVSINMVNVLPRFQWPSNFERHDMPVLSDLFAVHHDRFVFMRRFRGLREAINRHIFGQMYFSQAAARAVYRRISATLSDIKNGVTYKARLVNAEFRASGNFTGTPQMNCLAAPRAIDVGLTPFFKLGATVQTGFHADNGIAIGLSESIP